MCARHGARLFTPYSKAEIGIIKDWITPIEAAQNRENKFDLMLGKALICEYLTFASFSTKLKHGIIGT